MGYRPLHCQNLTEISGDNACIYSLKFPKTANPSQPRIFYRKSLYVSVKSTFVVDLLM